MGEREGEESVVDGKISKHKQLEKKYLELLRISLSLSLSLSF